MRKFIRGGVPIYNFHLLQKFADCADHGVFSREGGVSSGPFESLNVKFGIGDKDENVLKNRGKICSAMGVNSDRLVSAVQVHGNNVAIVDEELIEFNPLGSELNGVDALVTNLKGVSLMVQVADCQAMLMIDPAKKVVSAVHAGWKGLTNDVAGETICVMRDHYGCNPLNIRVGVSPSLGPCCSYFSDPRSELPADFHEYIDSENRVDLWKYGKDQLVTHGIAEGNIESACICTVCGGKGNSQETPPKLGSKFFSYRAGMGNTGRFGAVVVLV